MPVLKFYVPLSGTELAGLLGVAPSRISLSVHRGWHVYDYPIFDWAVWHPSGHKVKRYEVPYKIVKEEMPDPEEDEELYGTLQRKIEEEKFSEEEPIGGGGDDQDWEHRSVPE